METSDHPKRERLIIAEVSGVLKSPAAQDPDRWPEAVAELHSITTDPHLLAHAWHPNDVGRDELLRLAGANMAHVAQMRAEPEQWPQLGTMADRMGGRHEAYRRGE